MALVRSFSLMLLRSVGEMKLSRPNSFLSTRGDNGTSIDVDARAHVRVLCVLREGVRASDGEGERQRAGMETREEREEQEAEAWRTAGGVCA